MSHEANLHYDRALIKSAVLAFWKRSIGIGFSIALLVVAIRLTFLLIRGDKSWVVGALATCLMFSLAFAAALYFVHYRNALNKLRDMGAPQAHFLAEESSFTVTSGMGSSTLRWSAITEVWRFPAFWLLFFSKAQFVTLPLAALNPEMKTFILERVRAAGGTIDP